MKERLVQLEFSLSELEVLTSNMLAGVHAVADEDAGTAKTIVRKILEGMVSAGGMSAKQQKRAEQLIQETTE